MSRIGKKPIDIVSGVTVNIDGDKVFVKGSHGDMALDIPENIYAIVDDGKVIVTRKDDLHKNRSLHGLMRSLIANMIEGVSKGFTRELEIEGVGFRASLQGSNLSLSLGFASPVEYVVPEGVDLKVDGNTKIIVSSIDKQKVGETAARIRSFFPCEPYKGKGIRYKGEHIRRKEGKTIA